MPSWFLKGVILSMDEQICNAELFAKRCEQLRQHVAELQNSFSVPKISPVQKIDYSRLGQEADRPQRQNEREDVYKRQVQSSKTAKKETAAAATKQTLSEKISQKKAQSAQKAAAKSKTQNSGGYVLVDGVKLTPEELESRLESGSIVKTNRGGYAFAYQRYPYWRTMITK